MARLGAELSRVSGSDLILVSVVDAEEQVEARATVLEQIARPLRIASGRSIRHEVLVDPQALRGLRTFVDGDTTFVMTTGGSITPHDGHLGSMAEVLTFESGLPAMLMGPRAMGAMSGGPRFIVVPLDGSEQSETAIAPAAELAEHLDMDVWVVSVITASMAHTARAHGVGVEAESGYVRRVAARLVADGIRAEFEVLHGEHAAEAIGEFASRSGMCVMATHGRRGLARVVLGSTTTAVVRRAFWPTVVVPPSRVITVD